ncbi:tyrosine-type recombinase/integrase [Streptomyces camponoticapitis]|nr:tyrosine-type recombinase/integrase [Streptomyces camponoticapitis]
MIRKREWIDPSRSEITLCVWHRIWWPTQTGEEITLQRDHGAYTNHIAPKFGSLALYELDWLGIQTWVNELHDKNGGPLAASSVTKVFQVLDRMLEAARRDRRVPYNPAEGIKLPPIPPKHPEEKRPPTYAQLWLVRANLPKHMHALQILAQETGLRFGELAGLRWCRVDLEARMLHVREVLIEPRGKVKRKKYPKSYAGMRTVPLTGLAARVLRDLLDQEPGASFAVSEPDDGMREEELVFHGRNRMNREGKPHRSPVRRSGVHRAWVKAIQRAGVARPTVKVVTVQEMNDATGRPRAVEKKRTDWWPEWRDQRDAFASRLHALGMPEVLVQEVLGHERGAAVTWLYTHAAANVAGQVLAALEDKKRGQGQRLRLVA